MHGKRYIISYQAVSIMTYVSKVLFIYTPRSRDEQPRAHQADESDELQMKHSATQASQLATIAVSQDSS